SLDAQPDVQVSPHPAQALENAPCGTRCTPPRSTPLRYSAGADNGTVGSRTSKSFALRRHFCFAPSSRLAKRFTYTKARRQSAGFRRGVMSLGGSTPIRPITGRPSLAPSSSTRRLISSSCELPSLTGRRRVYHVPSRSLCGLGRASPPVAQQLRRRSSEPPDLATYLVVQACQHLALGLCDDVYRRFACVDFPTPSWFPTAVMLAVATWPRGCIAILADEATLFRELRTSRLPMTHVSVGYCGQYRRSCRF